MVLTVFVILNKTEKTFFFIFQLLLAQSDYQMIMSILSGNLAEGQTQEADNKTKFSSKTTPSSELQILASNKELTTAEVSTTTKVAEKRNEKPHIFLKFTFTMEQLIINLFTGKSETSQRVS